MELSPLLKLFLFPSFIIFFFSRSLLFHGTFVLHTPVSRLAVVKTRRVAPPTHAYTQPRIISHPRCRHYGKIVRFLSIGRNRFAVFDRQPSITVTVRPLPFRENDDLPSPFPAVSAVIDNSR